MLIPASGLRLRFSVSRVTEDEGPDSLLFVMLGVIVVTLGLFLWLSGIYTRTHRPPTLNQPPPLESK